MRWRVSSGGRAIGRSGIEFKRLFEFKIGASGPDCKPDFGSIPGAE
jgi:hypothetical protein